MKLDPKRMASILFVAAAFVGGANVVANFADDAPATQKASTKGDPNMQVQYLEIVTSDPDGVCKTYEKMLGVKFSSPVAELGNARTADLAGGGRVSVRAPMAAHEEPTIRPYILVKDIQAAVKSAEEAGAQTAHPPLELPGQGTFAIYIQGGNQHALWQN